MNYSLLHILKQTFLNKRLLGTLVFILSFISFTYPHAVQIGYCASCDDELKLWVEHWHDNQDPNSTTMDIEVTVNGVTTLYTGSPTGSVQGTTINNLPGCSDPLNVFYACPPGSAFETANQTNDWVSYEYPTVPGGANVNFTVLAGNTVFTQDGCGMYPASSGNFTLPTPVNVNITADQDICNGDDVTLTATPGQPGGTYLWSPGGQTTQSITVSPTAATTYSVDYTLGGGTNPAGSCPADAETDVDVITVQPTLDFQVQGSGGNQNVCPGDIVEFNDQSTVDGTYTINGWQWDINADGSIEYSGSPNPTHTFNNSGNFDVRLIVTSSNGCEDTIEGNVVVYPEPNVSFNVTDECINDVSNFNDATGLPANPPSNIDTWNWDFDDGNNSTQQNPDNTYGAPGDYDVELTVTTDRGCESSTVQQVSIFELPTPDFDANEACMNDPTQFTDQSSDPSGIASWDWDFDDGNNSTQQNPSHTYGSAGDYDVNLSVTSNNNCTNDVTQTITVLGFPTADFNFVEACEDSLVDFTDNSGVVAPATIQNYNWDFDDNGTVDNTNQNPQTTYSNFGSHTAELMIETGDGCKDSITYTFDVYPNPVADFMADPLCLNNPTNFQDQSTVAGAANITNWDWDLGNGNTANIQNPSETYGSAGMYSVTLEVTTGDNCTNSITDNIEIYPLPTADFTFNDTCYNKNMLFAEQASANSVDFEWDFGDGNTSVQPNPQNLYSTPNDYTVELIVTTAQNQGGCKDTIEKDVTAFPIPAPAFAMDNECVVDNISLTDQTNIANPSTLASWNWTYGDGAAGNTQNPTHLYNSEGIYDIQLIATSNEGCVDSLTKQVTIYPLPQVDFSPTEVCLNYNTQFSDQSTVSNLYSYNSNDQFEWDFGGGTQSTMQNPIHTYTSSGLHPAQLIVTTNHNCVDSNTINVKVHPSPNVSLTGSNLVGCSPHCFDLKSTSTLNSNVIPNDPSQITDYQWNIPGGLSASTGADVNLNECFENNSTVPDVYDVQLTVTTDKGCVDSTTVYDYIQINDNPVADFYYKPEKPTIIEPFIQMTNESENADLYQWVVEDLAGSTEEHPEFEFPPEPEAHKLTLIAETMQGCKDEKTSLVRVYDRLLMYVPNTFTPDGDDYNETFLPVMTSGFDPQNYTLLIYNRWGEPVFESHSHTVGWDGMYQGKIARQGAYVWKIIIRDSRNDDRKEYTGHVNLLK